MKLAATLFGAQVVLIVLFAAFTRYGSGAVEIGVSGNSTVVDTTGGVDHYYPLYQDVHVMIFVGFGFLMTFLKRYGFSSVGFNFLLAVLVTQWALLVNGFYEAAHAGHLDTKLEFDIVSLIRADFACGAVLISFGSVLGRTSPMQLAAMAGFEIIVYGLNEMIGALDFKAVDMGGSMFVHTFGAFFGIAAGIVHHRLSKPRQEDCEDHPAETSSRSGDMFAMVGTLFLWMFWPSFNGALATGTSQHRVIINTVLSLSASAVTAFAASSLFTPHRKFDMVHIQNATLAGGVAVGSSADLVIQPWGALLVGAIAGTLSVVGYAYIQPWLKQKIGLHDTCGVINLHGMPGILGAISGTIATATASSSSYGNSIGTIFPARSAAGGGRSAGEQAAYQFYALLMTLLTATVGGAIAGVIMSWKALDVPESGTWYADATDWENPEPEADKSELDAVAADLRAELATLREQYTALEKHVSAAAEPDAEAQAPFAEAATDHPAAPTTSSSNVELVAAE